MFFCLFQSKKKKAVVVFFVLSFSISTSSHTKNGNKKKQLLREKLKKCYKESGVNHLQDCAELVDQYMAAIKGGSGTEWINAPKK